MKAQTGWLVLYRWVSTGLKLFFCLSHALHLLQKLLSCLNHSSRLRSASVFVWVSYIHFCLFHLYFKALTNIFWWLVFVCWLRLPFWASPSSNHDKAFVFFKLVRWGGVVVWEPIAMLKLNSLQCLAWGLFALLKTPLVEETCLHFRWRRYSWPQNKTPWAPTASLQISKCFIQCRKFAREKLCQFP